GGTRYADALAQIQDRGALRRRTARDAVEAHFLFAGEFPGALSDVEDDRHRGPVKLIRQPLVAGRKMCPDGLRGSHKVKCPLIHLQPLMIKIPYDLSILANYLSSHNFA